MLSRFAARLGGVPRARVDAAWAAMRAEASLGGLLLFGALMLLAMGAVLLMGALLP